MLSSVLLIILAGLAFGAVHSALASMRVKNRAWRCRYRLFFSAASGVTFLPLLALTGLLPDRAPYKVRPVSVPWSRKGIHDEPGA